MSPWIEIDQSRIDMFTDATGDHQWIHVHPERAKNSPFGETIPIDACPGSLRPAGAALHVSGRPNPAATPLPRRSKRPDRLPAIRPLTCTYLVAGAGFEPATSGL